MTVAERREVLEHEAAHAAAALALGPSVSEVSIRSDVPGRLGSVTLLDPYTDINRARARKLMKMVAAAPAFSDGDVPTWPLRQDRTQDEKLLSILADGLGLDERSYNSLIAEMWALTLTPKFLKVYEVLELWLEQTPKMDHEAIVRAMVLAWIDGDE